MKQKLIAALVSGAIAGLAATSANAGPIQASYKIFAAEVFGDTSLSLVAPTVGYSLNNPITGDPTNPNTFRAEITLNDGEWDTAVLAPTAVLRDPSLSNQLNGVFTGYTNGNKTAVFTFTVGTGASQSFPVNSTVTFGSHDTAPVPLQAVKLDTKLKTPLDNACSPMEAQATATVKLFNASGTQFDTTETAAVFASNVALNASVVSSSAFTTPEASKVDVLNPSYGSNFTTPSDVTASATTIALGKIVIKDIKTLYDADGSNSYSVTDTDWGTDAAKDGGVSAARLNLKLTGKFQGAVTDSVFFASDEACTVALPVGATLSYNGDKTEANVSADVTGLALLAGTTREATVCYKVNGTSIIPTASFAVASGQLTKGTTSKELANPVCVGSLYTLGSNGVQLDVRNYIHKAQQDATGWYSVLRVINTDETQTVDVNAQIIDSDGNLIANGKILTLAPRAAKYISSADVESKLGGTFPAADNNNARLRITAAGSSIRVQNYHVNPVTGIVNEVSSAQGDEGFVDAVGPAHNVYTRK